jgi:hypothetical protein
MVLIKDTDINRGKSTKDLDVADYADVQTDKDQWRRIVPPPHFLELRA